MNNRDTYLTCANFSINCESFSLVGVKETDYETLYGYESDNIFDLFCLNRTNPITSFVDYKKRFQKLYSKQRHFQFIIKDRHGRDFGTIFTSKKGFVHGHSNFCIYLTESARGHEIGWHAFALFLRYMFEYEKLLKIYTEIMDDNDLSIRCARFFGMIEEGHYPNHYLRSDKSHIGVKIFAVYPSVINKNKRKYRTHETYNKGGEIDVKCM